MITETEAYAGITDKASHAFGERRTKRTKVMYNEGGVSYVYLCYGVHFLFNVVTGKRDEPHAVLIRGIYPIVGFDKILERTNKPIISYEISNGPGKLSKALGINSVHNGIKLNENVIWIEDHKNSFNSHDILVTERIGVEYAGEDAKLPYRFLLNSNFYSKKKRLNNSGA